MNSLYQSLFVTPDCIVIKYHSSCGVLITLNKFVTFGLLWIAQKHLVQKVPGKINDSQLSSIDSFPGFGPSEGKLNNYKA